MKTKLGTMKVLKVSLKKGDFLPYRASMEILELPEKESIVDDFYRIIGCDRVTFTNLTENVTIVSDDEGLLESGNPVFEITAPNGYKLYIPGSIIICKQEYTDDDIKCTGLSIGELFALVSNLEVKLIGVTK